LRSTASVDRQMDTMNIYIWHHARGRLD